MNYWNEPIQFLAREAAQVERLAPIYLAMREEVRGEFFVPAVLLTLAHSLGVAEAVGLRGSVNRPLEVTPPASAQPMVTTSYRDLLTAVRNHAKRPQIYLQYDEFKAAASERVSLFICPDETRRGWVHRNFEKKPAIVAETAQAAAEAIMAEAERLGALRQVSELNGESIGIMYMSFGEKAAQAVKASAGSLRRVGLQIPVCVIGSTPVPGFEFIEWQGKSPFDAHEKQNFQFRAGRIKPKLYELTPFERTLYIDADTEFVDDILPGFAALDEYDLALARETLTLKQLYNKALAGWEINIKERDKTIEELNGEANRYFLNSGVLFFRKSSAAASAMQRWHEAWLEWQQWDEQLALMRAIHRTPEVRVKVLEPEWNCPHRRQNIVIFHNYGRGVVRMNMPAAPFPARPKKGERNLGTGAEVLA